MKNDDAPVVAAVAAAAAAVVVAVAVAVAVVAAAAVSWPSVEQHWLVEHSAASAWDFDRGGSLFDD